MRFWLLLPLKCFPQVIFESFVYKFMIIGLKQQLYFCILQVSCSAWKFDWQKVWCSLVHFWLLHLDFDFLELSFVFFVWFHHFQHRSAQFSSCIHWVIGMPWIVEHLIVSHSIVHFLLHQLILSFLEGVFEFSSCKVSFLDHCLKFCLCISWVIS